MVFLKILPISFFQWCENSLVGTGIRHSIWQFPTIETIHLIGLTILFGSLMVVDLRLLGVVLRQHSVAVVASDFMIWFWTALLISVCTGVAMFLSEATRMSYNSAFFVKIVLIVLAVTFHLTVHRKVVSSGATNSVLMGKFTACLSLLCWLSVALAGRAIAFVVRGF
ncbi:MAG: hypothetical protein DMG30_26505 [Acidobacteria bacterium]|nr:MAG: hypothetical protein DMG30_26505 [Acidobacteriota bacterium]HEU0049826.1 DUF6644 family protein [Nitrososphaera sp.]